MKEEQSRHVVGVTGGGQGIGRAVAQSFAERGADVVVFELEAQRQKAEETVRLVCAAGGQGAFIPLDVTATDQIGAAVEAGARAFGPFSVWINNAGVISRKAALEVQESDWDPVVDVCLKGTFFCAQAAARQMRTSGGGSIINMASVFGLTGGANRAAYAASKGGIVNLTRALAVEWFAYGIRVNAVAPTFVRTPLTDQLLTKGLDVPNMSFGERFATLDQVCAAIHFLASDGADAVTGHTLPVDLGWTAH